MFTPPYCPHRACPRHLDPTPRFAKRHGTYHPLCRDRPVQRFLCRTCGHTFSRQTFRADFRDHRPDLNGALLASIAAGAGIRRTARDLGLSLRCTELKLRKIARHLAVPAGAARAARARGAAGLAAVALSAG